MTLVCLDASVIVKVLTREEGTEAASALVQGLAKAARSVVLPDLALIEVGGVLRQKVCRNLLDSEQAEKAWKLFRRLKLVRYLEADKYADRAWSISKEFGFPVLYDAAYLAVSELVSEESGDACEFWTADKKLFDSIKQRKAYARLLAQSPF